jgi:hypothetical protein
MPSGSVTTAVLPSSIAEDDTADRKLRISRGGGVLADFDDNFDVMHESLATFREALEDSGQRKGTRRRSVASGSSCAALASRTCPPACLQMA